MGCVVSKADDDDSPPLNLCRERKKLILAAADRRFALAAAHSSYLRSLASAGDALRRFADENLMAVPSPPSSPLVHLPPSDGKSKPSSGGDPISSGTSLTHSLSIDSHIHSESGPEPDGPSPNPTPNPVQTPKAPTPIQTPKAPSPLYNFMMSSSSLIPAVVYDDPYNSYGFPMNSPEFDQSRSQEPPPMPEAGSAWDFFDPFSSYDQYLPDSYRSYERVSVSSSPDSREVREKEGIPDLEDEMELETTTKERNKENDSVEATVKSASPPANEKEKVEEVVVSEEKTSESSSEGKSKEEEEGDRKGKNVILEAETETSMTREESGAGNLDLSAARGTRDVKEVVAEITDLFRSAAGCGEEVLRILEYGKLNYRSMSRISRVISSRILEPMGLSMLTSSRLSLKLSRHSALRNKDIHANIRKDNDTKLGSLSSTLEKLYVWEKKLYKEVKDEEKLRILYEKRRRQLRSLDNMGAESYKIEIARLSVRRLQTKISIVIKSMNAISSRMHKLRDEELQPQLTELVRGFVRMWRSLLECHQKQLLSILACKSHNIRARSGAHGNSAVEATMELELELLNWYSSFQELITTKISYIETLNIWLLKWLPQGQEVTADGIVPFSPSRIEAPAVFIISNDLFNAIREISAVKVATAMQTFALNVHKLWESQKEERHQKLKAEYLSRDYVTKLKSLQNNNGLHGSLDLISSTDNSQASHDDRLQALESMRKRLEDERLRHEEIVKQVQDAASSSLNTGLIPIFEALRDYSSETLKAYEGVRFPNEGRGT